MKNIGISKLNEKDVEHFTTDIGLKLRKMSDKPYKKLCKVFTNANIICMPFTSGISDDAYFFSLNTTYIPLSNYELKNGKNNIILERYPQLDDEPYIFVCNHTCPEDIETVFNIIDRNAYLILGSLDTLKHNPEAYLLWLNGVIPFDILDKTQRKQLIPKMERVLKTNSILIFPEGSHNYSPNNLVNKLFDGPVNLSLKTGRKIVVITLIRDQENNVSYIDASNPIELSSYECKANTEKQYVNELTACIRDKMATAVFYMISRHIKPLDRNTYVDIEQELRQEVVTDAFKKMKWKDDIFDAEYLVKRSKADIEYEEVVKCLSSLGIEYYMTLCKDLHRKNVAMAMRNFLYKQNSLQQIKGKR